MTEPVSGISRTVHSVFHPHRQAVGIPVITSLFRTFPSISTRRQAMGTESSELPSHDRARPFSDVGTSDRLLMYYLAGGVARKERSTRSGV